MFRQQVRQIVKAACILRVQIPRVNAHGCRANHGLLLSIQHCLPIIGRSGRNDNARHAGMARRLQNIGQVVAEGRVGKVAVGVGEHNGILKVQAALADGWKKQPARSRI